MIVMLPAALALTLALSPPPAGVRKEVGGWVVLQLAGKPFEIGQQYGSLASAEIVDAQKALAFELENDGLPWSRLKALSKQYFWPKIEPEYQEEIKGIAAGLAKKGVALDADDILALNSYIDIAWYYLPQAENAAVQSRAPHACSAFVSTGSATADGKVVMGHELWWGYVTGFRWNIILDVTPAKGYRFIFDCYPGFIHSGSDFALNSQGIALCETTISGFRGFDMSGDPEFIRMRRAIQYSGDLDQMVKLLRTKNNGGYTNTWLMADTKNQEIGKLILGLKNVIFHRSTTGSYYGANYPEDEKFIAEETPGDRSGSLFGNKARKDRWAKLLKANEGKIDSQLAQGFLADTTDEAKGVVGASSTTLCGRSDLDPRAGYALHGAVNAKVLTSDSARAMSFRARRGFPDGSTFDAASYFTKHPNRKKFQPFIFDVPAYPWVDLPPAGASER